MFFALLYLISPLKTSFLFSIFCPHVSSSYQMYSCLPNTRASSIKYFSTCGRASQGKNSHYFVKLLRLSIRPVPDFCPFLHWENSWERATQTPTMQSHLVIVLYSWVRDGQWRVRGQLQDLLSNPTLSLPIQPEQFSSSFGFLSKIQPFLSTV